LTYTVYFHAETSMNSEWWSLCPSRLLNMTDMVMKFSTAGPINVNYVQVLVTLSPCSTCSRLFLFSLQAHTLLVYLYILFSCLFSFCNKQTNSLGHTTPQP